MQAESTSSQTAFNSHNCQMWNS